MGVVKKKFGVLSDDREAFIFTIRNSRGTTANVTNFGAILVSLLVKNKSDDLQDVVLGYDTFDEYLDNHPMFGATVGRNANRISNASFFLDGKKYNLVKNRGEHNIHSDKEKGFHKVLWNYEITGVNAVTFSYISKDGEQGFPGTLYISVTYQLTDADGLIISYRAVSDKKTLLNITNHSYFNLDGHDSNNILDTEVVILSDAYTPVDKDIIPTGEICLVNSTPMDFNKPRKLGDIIQSDYEQLSLIGGFDHNFIINNSHIGVRKIAEAVSNRKGIKMDVYSDLPGMQFYTANSLNGSLGKNGKIYSKWSGFCMEPQYFPNSINTEGFESPIINAGEEYISTTIYQFSQL